MPDLALLQTEHAAVCKYAILRLFYLKTHRHKLYAKLLLSGELHAHLAKVDLLARKMVHDIVSQTIRKISLPDKATQQMKRVDTTNELKHEAE